ncbi:MAG: Zn-ribbon containing protein [Candidatus Nanoarchaeia archaeon]|nr:Zn-ribbon containing protein [Candidatus Nanoarchaeia archaeon]
MPHQCVKCGKLFEDGSKEILSGCSACSGKFFFYVKKANLEKAKEITESLTLEEKEQMEKDVTELIKDDMKEDQPVILDLESIRVVKPGKYELDLVDLFKGKPLVYKLDDGKYMIDIVSTLSAKEKKLDEKFRKLPENSYNS